MVIERIPARFGLDPVRDIQVLTPMNHGGLGVRALNVALQAALSLDAQRNGPCDADLSPPPILTPESLRASPDADTTRTGRVPRCSCSKVGSSETR